MMKKLLLSLFMFSLTLQVNAQDFGYKWVWFSEVSPNAAMHPTMHEGGEFSHNFSFRNRLGIMVGENTIFGLVANYRQYDLAEERTFVNGYHATDYQFESRNKLFGAGFFATQLIPINKKLELQVNLFGFFEQGKGQHDRFWERLYTIEPGVPVGWPIRIDPAFKEFQERNFISGLELGGIYYLNPSFGFQGSVRLIQLEWNRLSDHSAPYEQNPSHYLDMNREGGRFFHVGQLPAVQIGIVYHFGLPR